jgi:hypothetical protein
VIAAREEPCSSATGAYCRARQRLPEERLWRLMRETGQALEAQAPTPWKWQGRPVKLVDGTTVSMPDTDANQEAYPQPSGPSARPGVSPSASGGPHRAVNGGGRADGHPTVPTKTRVRTQFLLILAETVF